MRFMNKKESRGFTLLELLLVLGVVGIISTFAISIAGSVRNMSNVSETKNRMIEIAAKAKQYYRAHESLPGPDDGAWDLAPQDQAILMSGNVPVQAANFDLEQKYRLDSWGQYLVYTLVIQDEDLTNVANDNDFLDIDHLDVNGKNVAAVLISGGPDQTINTIGVDSDTDGFTIHINESFTLAGDDIVVPINVSKEAMEIVLEELKVLQDKVYAFDAIFEGVDNGLASGIPDDGATSCQRAEPLTSSCPPISGLANNDPNCGTMTLDEIDSTSTSYINCAQGYTPQNTLGFIIGYYGLSINYQRDPWLNNYVWGRNGLPFTDTHTTITNITNSIRHYHKFFSAGPNGLTGFDDTTGVSDDIIP